MPENRHSFMGRLVAVPVTILGLAALSVSCNQEEAPAPEPEPEIAEPHFFSHPADENRVEYVSPDEPNNHIILVSYPAPDQPDTWRWDTSWCVNGQNQVTGSGREPTGNWLDRIFDYETLKSREPASISVGGKSVEGEIVKASTADGTMLTFEMTPAVPTGGLVRVYRQPQGGENALWFELAKHTPTEALQSIEAPEFAQPDSLVVYFDSLDSLDAIHSAEKFLSVWMKTGQSVLDSRLLQGGTLANLFFEIIPKLSQDLFDKDPTSFDQRLGYSPISGMESEVAEFSVLGATRDGVMIHVAVEFNSSEGHTSHVTYETRRKDYSDGTAFDLMNAFYSGHSESLRSSMESW